MMIREPGDLPSAVVTRERVGRGVLTVSLSPLGCDVFSVSFDERNRSRCLSVSAFSILVLLSMTWADAWAQTAPHLAQQQAPSGNAPPALMLPPINVTAASRSKRTAAKRRPAKPAPAAAPVPAVAPPPAQTETTANIASGANSAPTMASQMTIPGRELNGRAVTRPGEILEAAPGLAVISHADGGKANQYYLRGYNLDHGTDFAVFVDDMPINLPTHAHGQGYADLNWLMPKTVQSLDVRKGPYFADVGDFANAGAAFLNLRDSVDKTIVSVTAGSFDYQRYFTMGSTKLGGGSLLYAGEANLYDGPWDTPDHMRKFSGLMRYSQGTATDGFSATAMAYANKWTTTGQQPLRAIASGQIGLFGEIDPTDGGNTSRYSLSARVAQTTDDGSWKANAYLVKYQLDLFNDFTWFLTNPIDGDQFQQHDDRVSGGAGASRTFRGSLFGRPAETLIGFQTRYDDINVALNNTVAQRFLSANSGRDQAAIGSPKFRMTIGPFYKTEFFIGAGMGYHSNDARSTVITQVPGDPATPESASPFLVRSRGAEIGVRTKIVPGLDSSVSLFTLYQASELFFSGDTGETVAGLPSQRTGIEFTNDYRPTPWLHIDADVALTRARFVGFDSTQAATYESLNGYPQAQIGNAPGNFVYNAPWMVASAGITLGRQTGWFGNLRWRYISSRPLTQDGAFWSPPLSIVNGQIGYRFDNGWRIQLDALNLLNSQAPQAEYAYGSLLKTDNLFAMCNSATPPPKAVCQNGVMDYVLHPIEPLAIRLTVAASF
jgi:hypothetical protein